MPLYWILVNLKTKLTIITNRFLKTNKLSANVIYQGKSIILYNLRRGFSCADRPWSQHYRVIITHPWTDTRYRINPTSLNLNNTIYRKSNVITINSKTYTYSANKCRLDWWRGSASSIHYDVRNPWRHRITIIATTRGPPSINSIIHYQNSLTHIIRWVL